MKAGQQGLKLGIGRGTGHLPACRHSTCLNLPCRPVSRWSSRYARASVLAERPPSLSMAKIGNKRIRSCRPRNPSGDGVGTCIEDSKSRSSGAHSQSLSKCVQLSGLLQSEFSALCRVLGPSPRRQLALGCVNSQDQRNTKSKTLRTWACVRSSCTALGRAPTATLVLPLGSSALILNEGPAYRH